MLVVVSNRVASPTGKDAGGLAVALKSMLKDQGGLWLGWSGRTTQSSGTTHESRHDGVDYVTVDLAKNDFDRYYSGFSNRVLWPLLHYRPDLIEYRREDLRAYQAVNRLFAQVLAKRLRREDIVWIHDYHLIAMAAELRRLGVKNPIGFFLHIPVPSADLLSSLPRHGELFGALTACDLVGVQTAADRDRLRSYFAMLRESGDGNAAMAVPKVEAHPISIDTALIERLSAAAADHPLTTKLARSLDDKQLVIGVDRLDYSKGLPERFHAFGRYLEKYDDGHGQVSYLQIAPPSRGAVPEYRTLREELEQQAGHINGGYARPDWVPIRYVNCSYPHEVLAGYYRLARVGLVTPLRDGMNLVAKEFVAAQDPEDPGVLVLSKFAGAADELGEGALLINPYDVDAVSDALRRALRMPLPERRERWERMMRVLREHDLERWGRNFLESLGSIRPMAPESIGRARVSGTSSTDGSGPALRPGMTMVDDMSF